jgi:hypothetical protein
MQTGKCELCEREGCHLTKHHLVPRARHNKKVKREQTWDERNRIAWICRPCHSQLHMFYTEKELERKYNTLELLKEQPEVQKWIAWISTKHLGKVG